MEANKSHHRRAPPYQVLLQAGPRLKPLRQVHAHIIVSNLTRNLSIITKLITFTCAAGAVNYTRRLFLSAPNPDSFIFNSIIKFFSKLNLPVDALWCYHRMLLLNIAPSSYTFTSLIKACATLSGLKVGRAVHCHVFVTGEKGVEPDCATFVSVLSACAQLGDIGLGRFVHDYAVDNGFDVNMVLGTSFVTMFSRCGNLTKAREIFDSMKERNVVAWTSMISGYGMHGNGRQAVDLFNQMRACGIRPNTITFVAVLSACAHGGLVDEGRKIFTSMKEDYGLTPGLEHQVCVVDMLGRAGLLHDAYQFIKQTIPCEADPAVWTAMLGACKMHKNYDLGVQIAEHLLSVEPTNPGHYVMLSNIYAAAGKMDRVETIRNIMIQKKLSKNVGYTTIQVDNTNYLFSMGDKSHHETNEIYRFLDQLVSKCKAIGYVPAHESVLHELEEEETEYALRHHSEKLAIAFGLLKTSDGSTISIVKNLRMCEDCHSAIKYISIVTNREIIVRDKLRFHHFKDGSCSCLDYWSTTFSNDYTAPEKHHNHDVNHRETITFHDPVSIMVLANELSIKFCTYYGDASLAGTLSMNCQAMKTTSTSSSTFPYPSTRFTSASPNTNSPLLQPRATRTSVESCANNKLSKNTRFSLKWSEKALTPLRALVASKPQEISATPAIGSNEKIGVLLLNLGGPETLEDVQPFLFNLFADPDIIRLPRLFGFLQKPLAQFISVSRAPKSKEGYASIGGGSPLRRITDAQAEELKKALWSKNVPAEVYVGMRYWHPFTEEAIEQIKKDGITKLVVLPLYPQFSISTSGSSLRLLERIFREDEYLANMQHTVIPSWYQRDGYIKAMADLIQKEIEKFDDPRKVVIFFSAHGVPLAYVEEAGDPYKAEMEECVDLIMEELEKRKITNAYTLAYQSRVGPVEWLKPYTDETIVELGKKGVKSLLAVPISFVSEHIETLEEIDVEYKELALKSGIENWGRVPALGCEPTFISDLADAVIESLPYVGAMRISNLEARQTLVPLGSVEELLATYDSKRRELPSPVTVWEWGWTRSAETWNGRAAMLAVLVLLFLEVTSGEGLLHQVGIMPLFH
ncbi:hypothetical protein ACFE04_016168 [Oxalis oulophora]